MYFCTVITKREAADRCRSPQHKHKLKNIGESIMVQNPQFLINIRKNINANNPGYGKYYPKAVEKETITLRGLAKHMSEHQCVYSRDIIEGVLIKMVTPLEDWILEQQTQNP